MAGTDKNTTKIRFYLNLEIVKNNAKTKHTEEHFKNCLKVEKAWREEESN